MRISEMRSDASVIFIDASQSVYKRDAWNGMKYTGCHGAQRGKKPYCQGWCPTECACNHIATDET